MKKNKELPVKNNNALVSGFISAFFDIVKHFLSDFENRQKVKKIDRYQEGMQNLEHLIIRLEEKLENQRRDIEELKNRLMWGNIVIIVLLLISLYHIIIAV
jgi:uncharacterized membrane protein (DUF106 family)